MSTLETNLIQPATGTTLTVGASGDTITIPSGATITNSGTASGFGKVLQVISATHATEVTSTSSSYADTGLTASITPSSTSNKVLVIVNQNGLEKDNTDTKISVKLLRGSTDIALFAGTGTLNTSTANRTDIGGTGVSILDTPNSTSSTTYKTQLKNQGSGTVAVQNGGSVSSITLMEIAG